VPQLTLNATEYRTLDTPVDEIEVVTGEVSVIGFKSEPVDVTEDDDPFDAGGTAGLILFASEGSSVVVTYAHGAPQEVQS
jgi:hypothetical protein